MGNILMSGGQQYSIGYNSIPKNTQTANRLSCSYIFMEPA